MSSHVSRREFLGTTGRTAAGVAAGLTLGNMLREARAAEANDRFGVALVGCGGMGRYKLGNFIDTKQVNLVAVCDVDPAQLDLAVSGVRDRITGEPKRVKDYRQVMDMKDVDLVIIATPDHWHAAPAILACQAGKDIYCEKPCSHNVREGRLMLDAAHKYKRVVQVGTHQRSMPHLQEAMDFVRSGKLGTVTMTETFTFGNDSPQGMGTPEITEPPPGVDYDMWLGPAPRRPFNRNRFHGSWRWFFDYAAGMVGDWNVHLQDIVMWTMQTPNALSVSTSGGKLVLADDRDTPDTMQAVYEFGPSPSAPNGYVQTYTMRKASGKPWSAGGYGMVLHGTNGRLYLNRGEWKLEPDRKDWNVHDSEWRAEAFHHRADGADQKAHFDHVVNFLDCVRSRKEPIASIDAHFNIVTACHLANVSLLVGRKIFWDAKAELCFTDRELKHKDRQANALLTREYRKGYELPKV
jgi:predicted dehydrogenase